MTTTNLPLRFHGQTFYAADRIGFTTEGHFIVDVLTTPPPKPCGSLLTTIPISSKSYRETHKSQASASRDGSEIIIVDDWGKQHTISGDDALLNALENELREQGLWRSASPAGQL